MNKTEAVMIDIHSHILFGVDDGAETFEESMELIKEEVEKGVSHIIFTPHFNKRNYHQDKDKTFG
jgi:protein-tyrosine phosphatase